LGISTGGQ